MAKYKLISEDTLTGIADAIREKSGKSDAMTPLEMPQEILDISSGGSLGLKQIFKILNNEPIFFFGTYSVGTGYQYLDDDKLAQILAYDDTENCTALVGFFYNQKFLTKVNADFGNATNINYMFADTGLVEIPTTMDFSKVTTMQNAFQYSALTSVKNLDLSNLVSCSAAFSNTPIASLDNVALNKYANKTSMFSNCTKLESISNLTIENTKDYPCNSMFNGCTALKKITNVKVSLKSITASQNDNFFAGCTSLEELPDDFFDDFAAGYYMFNGCTALKKIGTIKFSNNVNISNAYMFTSCLALEKAIIDITNYQSSRSIQYMFNNCISLDRVEIKSDASLSFELANYMFNNCYRLTKIILRTPFMVTLTRSLSSATTSYSPIYNCYHFFGTYNATYNSNSLKDGYIYVPDDLLDTYKANTYWKSLSSQILPISELGELFASTFTLYSKVGTTQTKRIYFDISFAEVSFSVISDDATIGEVLVAEDNSFIDVEITAPEAAGSYTISVTAITSDDEITQDITFVVAEETKALAFYVSPESSSSNRQFVLTYDGYYTVSGTGGTYTYYYAIVTFIVYEENEYFIRIYSDGEYQSDYAIVSALGTELTKSYVADTSNVLYSFKNDLPSTETKDISLGVLPNGTYTFTVKYIRDSSKSMNSDKAGFTIVAKEE